MQAAPQDDEQIADLIKARVSVRQLAATEVTAFARGVKDVGAVIGQVRGLIKASIK